MAPTPIIGVVLDLLGGYYCGGIFAGAQRAAYQRGYRVLALKGRPRDLVRAPFARDLIQGWVFIHDNDGLDQLARQGVPFVCVATHPPGLERPAVLADNFGGTRATSASVFDTDRQQSLLAGCNAFVPKPIRVEQLLEVLADQLGLTWRYTEGELIEPAQRDGTDTVVPPPEEQLAALFDLASIGDIIGLQIHAAQIVQRDPALRPFARKLGHFASRFESEQALALIARYLQSEQ